MGFAEYLGSLAGKRVFVVGAGVSNTPLIEALLGAGVDVTVCDRRMREELGAAADKFEADGAGLRLGDDYIDNIDADVVFRTPGLMPWNDCISAAAANGAVITSEMEVFFDVCPCPIIGITGSDGKTTTTSLIGDILKNEGRTVHIGGNIGMPVLCKADSMNKDDIAVLELSSFQLISMKKSPHISVVTNISPNHLDVHRDMKEYVDAKRNILAHQGNSDRAVLNLDNAYTRAYAGEASGETVFFSRCEKVDNGVFLKDGTIHLSQGGCTEPLMKTSGLYLPGLHNVENYMAAFAAVRGLAGVNAMQKTANGFSGVAHRIEHAKQLRGVRYYNDSSASSPSRTIAALKSFDKKVILIAGGKGKGVAFDELGKAIIAHVKTLILTGMTAWEIRESVENAPGYDGKPDVHTHENLEEAVIAASEIAEAGDIVLFSPASTSFDSFRNFEERGEAFKDIVRKLGIRDWAIRSRYGV